MFHSFFGQQEVQEFWVWTNCQGAKILGPALKTLIQFCKYGICWVLSPEGKAKNFDQEKNKALRMESSSSSKSTDTQK